MNQQYRKGLFVACVIVVAVLLAGCGSDPAAAPAPESSAEISTKTRVPKAAVYSPEGCWEAGGIEYHWRGSLSWRYQMPSCVIPNPQLGLLGVEPDCYSTDEDWPELPNVNKYVIELLATQRGETFEGDFSRCQTLPVKRPDTGW